MCIFLNEEAYKNQEFIYFEKYGMVNEEANFKMISINEKQIKWNKNGVPKDFILDIIFNKLEKKDQEVEYRTGNLNLEFDDGRVIESNFVGYCGC